MLIKHSLFLLLAAILTGLFAGILGTVYTENYLERYVNSLEQETAWQLQLSEERSRPNPGSYEEALGNARASLLPALVVFYNTTDETIILPNMETGLGVVLTSDGWVATTEAALGSLALIGEETFTVTTVVRDPLTDVVFVDLEASGLPVIAFGDAAAAQSGEQLFIGVGVESLMSTFLVDARSWQAAASANAAERFLTAFEYSQTLPIEGAPVVDGAGELVAIGTTPLHHLTLAITSAIRSGEVVRASFGASVTDLSEVRLAQSLRRDFTRGAFVNSVTIGGPAAIAGLRYGDIITRVQDVSLSRDTSLAEVLAGFEPGKRVSVIVDRNGSQMTFEVELGELP